MRIILDTNLWSSLDDGSLPQLEEYLAKLDLQILVLPSTLLEIVEIPHEDVRKKLVTGLARGKRTRSRTEADLFAEEVVGLIDKTRPQWLLGIPNRARVESLRTLWLKKVWKRALEDSTAMHEDQIRESPMRKEIIRRQRINRTELLDKKASLGDLKRLAGEREEFALSGASLSGGLPGWDGSRRELWRVSLAQLLWYQLGKVGPRAGITGEDRTMTDWIEPWVDLGKLRSDPDSFIRMLLEDATINDVPRNWLNWAVDLVQSTMKIGSGNPADAQHSSYLIDCEFFLTADSRFVEILERVRIDAPFAFAETVLVDGNRATSTADRIETALSRIAQQLGSPKATS